MENLIYSKYKIECEIRAGSQATIYKVTDVFSNRQAAMKLFNKKMNSIADKINISFKEFSIINDCSNNNIIKAFDYGIDDKLGPFYIMEFYDGLSLSQYVSENQLNEENWWEILEGIIKALMVVHNRGYLHGDLKPSDILVKEKEKTLRIKLIDFDLAERIEDTMKGGSSLMKGTIPYIAPEKYSGNPYDHRADFYSLGIMLYELITKQSILALAMVKQWMKNAEILERLGRLELKPPHLYSNISKELSAVIFKMISLQPSQRYESALEIYEVINNWKRRHTPNRTNPLKNYFMSNKIVNRQKELTAFKEIAETYVGEGHLFVCSGQVGIGKSTFGKLAKNYCQQKGYFVIQFENKDQPLQYFIKLINKHQDQEDKIEQFDKTYLFERLKDLFNKLINKYSGIMVMVEDYDDLNKAEKALIDYLLKQLNELPVLWFILTEDGSYFQKNIFPLLKQMYYSILSLKNLGVEEIKEMIQSMFPFSLITPAVAKKIYEYSEGVPLSAIESVSYLVNLIEDFRDISEVASLWEKILLPEKEVFQIKKLEKVDASVKKVLSYAAIMGKSFREDILIRIVPKHLKNRLYSLLEDGISNNLIIYEISSNQYTFQSDIIKENLLKDIGKKEKVVIDESIARAYEEVFIDKDNLWICSTIAEHYAKAGIYEKAIEYYQRAAAQADKLKLYEDTYEYYAKILRFLDLISANKKEKVAILNKIAQVCFSLGKLDEAINYYQEISNLSKEEDKIEPLLKQSEILYRKSAFDKMIKILDEVKKFELKNEANKIEFNILMAEGNFGLGRYEEAIKYINQAYNLAKEMREPSIISKTLNVKGNILVKQAKFEEAESSYREALEQISERKDSLVANIYCNLANLYLEKSMLKEAIEVYSTAIEIYKEDRDIFGLACSNHNLAIIYGKMGKTAEAIEAFKTSMFNFHLINNKSQLKFVYNNMAALYEEMGDLDKALDYYNEAMRIAIDEDDKEIMAIIYANIANIHSIKGIMSKARDYLKLAKELLPKVSLKDQILIEEIEGSYYYNLREAIKAIRSYESALEKAVKLNLRLDRARLLVKLAEASIYAKNLIKAKDYISQAEGLYIEEERVPEYTYYLRIKAFLLKKAGQTIEARRYLQKAISLAKEFGQIYLLGKLYFDLGNIYYKRRILDKAKFYLQQARDIFERIGGSSYLRRIQILNERIDKYEKPSKKISSVIPNYFIDYIEEIISYISKPTEFYKKVLEKAIDFVEAERGVILLFDENTGDMIIKAAIGADEMTIRDVAEISQTAIKEMKKQKDMIFSKCAKDDPKFKDRPSIVSHEILSLACVPLQINERVIGALYLDSKKSANLFTITDRRMLALFAKLISRSIEIAEGYSKISKESYQLKLELELKHKYPEIIGNDPKLLKALELVDKVADKDVNVLILGESGTGKELIAKAIHFYGKRRENKFFAVNCAAFTESLLESELFGHERGAFTGAVSERKGIFEEAEGGTLFLDEISETSLAMQAKLLRAIQHNEIKRIGSNKIIKVNVRIIAASNKNLIKLIKEGKFRKDLYYRLAVVVIKMPPLRKMQEDIPLLAHHFLKKFNLKYDKHFKGFTLNAVNVLRNYPWPGNARELENVIERIVATGKDSDYIDIEHFPKKYITGAKLEEVSYITEEGRFKTLPEMEREIILQRLNATNWNIMVTAETLGITRFGLYNKMKRLGIQFEMKKGRKPKDASVDPNILMPAGKPRTL